MTNLYFPICAFFCSLLLIITFFCKQRIKSDETKYFSGLLITSFLDSIFMVLIIYIAYVKPDSKSLYYLNRLDFFQYLFWARNFFLYFYSITFMANSKKKSVVPKITLIINIIISIFIVILPLDIHTKNNIMYASGSSVDILYIACAIYFALILVSVLFNIRKIRNRKFIPLVALIFLVILLFIARNTNPSLLIIPAILAYIDLIMFFTIENPDLKMIYELNKNKKLVESAGEEKSNFLFSVSQETKKPIENILEVKKILDGESDLEAYKRGLLVIENNARSLKSIVNNVLDISNINISRFNVDTEIYNVYNVLNLCIKQIEQQVPQGVELRTNISNNIPKELYGDSFKLRQILMSILVNAVKYTKEGYIEINANEIIKYDTCRLIIDIEDSGCGLGVEKLNELLKSNSSLENTDLLKLDGLDVDLRLAFKIAKKIGGYINIKSEEKKGSTFTVVIDQKIKTSEEKYYNKYIFNNKKVMVVSDKLQTLKEINSLAGKYDIELLTGMFGDDLVNRIKENESFDLIILEDEMNPISALTTLKKIKEIKKDFKIPIIVMLKPEKQSLSKHYLEDGFKDFIKKDMLEQEIDRIIKKYI